MPYSTVVKALLCQPLSCTVTYMYLHPEGGGGGGGGGVFAWGLKTPLAPRNKD